MAPAWLTSFVAVNILGTVYFANNACHNIETVLPQQIVGQDLALTQLTESVCQHIAQKQPKKPLVISVHGPPGVGKTYTHWWLARALYNQQPALDLDCPGIHCRGYKVVYGLDYFVSEAAERLERLKGEVVSHLAAAPDALLVVEEYDKLSCEARGMWRQLLQHPQRANITSHRSVILMESNLGMTELAEMLTQAGDRSKLTMKDAEELLRNVVFEEWRKTDCEGFADTNKLMQLIDVFLPYLPLEQQHMPQLVELSLKQQRTRLERRNNYLEWKPGVVTAIANQITFDGSYPFDGAKVIDGVMTRTVNRLIRREAARPGCRAYLGCTMWLSVQGDNTLTLSAKNNTAAMVQKHKQAHKAALQQQQQLQHQHEQETKLEL